MVTVAVVVKDGVFVFVLEEVCVLVWVIVLEGVLV